ncbi:MAG: putative ABC exporter domain-containing protein [Fimbriimonadales bacterium]|nr:putative ABC exporter domain-containing protein [Fimbriimonadales bacterium]
MKALRPLLFLTFRTLVNGVRRALTSPRRLIGLLFLLSYYFWFFIRPGLGRGAAPTGPGLQLDFPALDLVEAVLFGWFSALSLMLALGIFAYRGGFKPADVDVLFATPIPAKAVLVFRIVREYLGTLILPLFLVLIAFRPVSSGWRMIFREVPNPETAGLVGRAMTVSWILMALTWVAIAYAASLFVNRSDLQSDRNKRLLVGGTVGLFLAVAAYAVYGLLAAGSVQDAVRFSHDPILRAAFFTASCASMITMAPITGSWASAALGAGILFAVMAAALRVAFSQVGWMYDQAAARAFRQSEARELGRRGDLLAIASQRAREGKIRVRRQGWWHRRRWRGVAGLLWKELLVQGRGGTRGLMFLGFLMGVVALLPAFVGGQRELGRAGPIFSLAMVGLGLLNVSMTASLTGCMEMLRRVDVVKAMPFAPWRVVAAELAAQSLYGLAVVWIPCLVLAAIQPGWWDVLLGACVLAAGLSYLICAAVLAVSFLFPDEDDATGVQFRRLMMLLGVVIACAPPIGAFVGLGVLGVPWWLAAWPAVALAAGIAVPTVGLASGLYAVYNPSE